MVRVRLRTKFLLSLVGITALLTAAILAVVQNHIRKHAQQEIYEALNSSVVTFQQFERQRERTLAQSAGLLADLPNLRALMTTHDVPTIQDASTDMWHLAGSDLFLLADRTGKVMALHTATAAFSWGTAQASLTRTLQKQQSRGWWFEGGHLYEVFLQPIYFGSSQDSVLLGILALGFEVDDRLAGVMARVASGQVAIRFGKDIVVSTLLPSQQQELAAHENPNATSTSTNSEELRLGGENFLSASLGLASGGSGPVSLTVLKSYRPATLFLQNLNRLLIVVGLVTVLAGAWLIFLISHTFTRPLSNLVSGVHALEKGDFAYPLKVRSHDEVGELTMAFDRMRKSLEKSQRDLLHSERLATIGRMASSISHDLRHPLTSILAYAEFLSESNLDDDQRKNLYQEIRQSVNKMAELIASLLEFSKAQEALQPVYGDVADTLGHTISAVQLHPEFRRTRISFMHEGPTQGWFDFKKLDRVFYNLLQNACEAAPSESGKVEVTATGLDNQVEISILDNGSGIPETVREDIFQPFVTCGKEGGTGLGLAVAQKIVRDHGGTIRVASTGPAGTRFTLILPVTPPKVHRTPKPE